MNEWTSLVEFGRKYGWWLPAFYLTAKYGNVLMKKRRGTYVSYKNLEKDMSEIKTRLDRHLEKEAIEDQELAILKTTHSNLEKRLDEVQTRIEKNISLIWQSVDAIKTHLMGPK